MRGSAPVRSHDAWVLPPVPSINTSGRSGGAGGRVPSSGFSALPKPAGADSIWRSHPPTMCDTWSRHRPNPRNSWAGEALIPHATPDLRRSRPICPDDEVRLLDEDDNEVTPGEVGEFCVRGPYTLRGYYGAPEHNARAFTTDGFYRSGDLMREHPSGNYIVEGRKKDLINRGGEKISAEEIENLILQHVAVKNVACVPMPDERLGERMCAYVVLQANQTLGLEDLVDFLNAKEIARFKLPERLESGPPTSVGQEPSRSSHYHWRVESQRG